MLDFVVIGAQKCGTTTLYEDLDLHPELHLAEKESRALCGTGLGRAELARRYGKLRRGVPDDCLFGEVSTRYAMLPDDPETPSNARMLAPDLKVVYIVRNPIDRVISHHHHDFGLGFVGGNIDEALLSYPALLDNSRYATQVKPWLDAFGRDSVTVIKFEDYMADRVTGLRDLLSFVGAPPKRIDPGSEAHNSADTKYIAPGRLGTVARNPLYRSVVRPLLGDALKKRLYSRLLPGAPPRPDPPEELTLRHIVRELNPEVERLALLTGHQPLWDLESSLHTYLGQ